MVKKRRAKHKLTAVEAEVKRREGIVRRNERRIQRLKDQIAGDIDRLEKSNARQRAICGALSRGAGLDQ